MGMAQSRIYWTADMLDSLPDDGNRYEVIDGELYMTPAPSETHQDAIRVLLMLIHEYCTSIGLKPIFAPFAVKFSNAREVQPDMIVVPEHPGSDTRQFDQIGALSLVVEVLSKSTGYRDRGIKRDVYRQQGVPEYWIINPKVRTVEQWRAGSESAELCEGALSWQPVASHPALMIDIARYFRAVHGELDAPQ